MFSQQMNLDGEVHQDINVHPAAYEHKDAFGIEIELEGLNILTEKPAIRKFWGMHQDGSLRANIHGRAGGAGQAMEYVSMQPFSRPETSLSLKLLFDFLNGHGVTVFPSYRTSVHVHVNCGRETWRTVYNYITLAIIFDELFSSLNGEHRIGNNFCLRFVDAEAPVQELVYHMENYGRVEEIPANMRYSSINFAALKKFGTIEFRSMECTTDLHRVERWINTLQRMKEAARGFANPVDIIGMFSRYTEHEFAIRVLGEHYHQFKDVPHIRAILRRGMRLAQDFAYSSTWQQRDAKWKPPKPKTYDEMMAAKLKQMQEMAPEPAGWAPAPPPGWGVAIKPVKPKPVAGQLAGNWNNNFLQQLVAEPQPQPQPQPVAVEFGVDDDEDEHHFDFDDEED